MQKTKARAAVSKEGILRWFNEVSGYLKEENVLEVLKCPERIYNADESGFQLCPKTGKVLGPHHKEDVYYMVPNNKKGANYSNGVFQCKRRYSTTHDYLPLQAVA